MFRRYVSGAKWHSGSVTTLGGASSFLLPIFLYKDRVGFFVRSHLITLPNPLRERSKFSKEGASALFFIMVFPPFRSFEKMVDHVSETFKWHLRGASRPPQSLPKNYHDLCPGFTLSDEEEAARDFNIPKMIQANFYAMVVNDSLGLGVTDYSIFNPLL